MLTALRTKQQRFTPRLLVALGVVWLNMVLNPCAMALGEMNDHDCPHCPPVQHCDEQVGDTCTFIDSIDSDGRTYQTRAPEFSDLVFALPAVPAPVRRPTADIALIAGHLRATGPPDPPLYISYCAYLK